MVNTGEIMYDISYMQPYKYVRALIQLFLQGGQNLKF